MLLGTIFSAQNTIPTLTSTTSSTTSLFGGGVGMQPTLFSSFSFNTNPSAQHGGIQILNFEMTK